MALKTASIKNQTSGLRQTLRISIMSRHTLNDGVTPDPEINMGSYDMWMTELAPPPKLIGAYYRNEISWAEFAEQFNAYLLLARPQEVLQTVINLAKMRDVTLMCVEPSPEFCHRRLVAEAIQKKEPDLEVLIE